MKKFMLIIILFICCFGIYATELTDEQLIQIVRNFENNQNLSGFDIRYKEKDQQYELRINNHFWTVDNTGLLIFASNSDDLIPDFDFENNDNILPQNQCKNIAINYLNNKNISLAGLDRCAIQKMAGCYDFIFFKFVAPYVLGQNRISVSVNVVNGNVQSFGRTNRPELNLQNYPFENMLNREQITNIINNEIFPNENNEISLTGYSYYPEESLFIIRAYVNKIIITFDALSGNIIKCDYPGSGSFPIKEVSQKINKYKNQIKKETIKIKIIPISENKNVEKILLSIENINLVLCDTENPKDVKYTVIPTGFEIDKEDKGIARMEVNGKKFIFRNGSYWCFINNKTYNIGGNCIIKDGILQLPEDFYKKVQTKDYDFFPKSQNSITK